MCGDLIAHIVGGITGAIGRHIVGEIAGETGGGVVKGLLHTLADRFVKRFVKILLKGLAEESWEPFVERMAEVFVEGMAEVLLDRSLPGLSGRSVEIVRIGGGAIAEIVGKFGVGSARISQPCLRRKDERANTETTDAREFKGQDGIHTFRLVRFRRLSGSGYNSRFGFGAFILMDSYAGLNV